VLEIALASGFEAPEAFARAFKRASGQSPSESRRRPEWARCCAAYGELRELRATHMKAERAVFAMASVERPVTAGFSTRSSAPRVLPGCAGA
jgi:AraC family transcriptional regulator